jgi:protein-disulfide isomerase
MDQADKTKQYFLIGTGILVLLMVGGLVWAIASGPDNQQTGGGTQVDPSIVFDDTGNPSVGPTDAKVTVRVFSDFQCPACRLADGALRKSMEAYKDRVRFVWNDFPLVSIHANAMAAAIGARCADGQGKFWEFGDRIFATQDQWSKLPSPNAYFEEAAGALGVRKDAFAACLTDAAARQKVTQDMQVGQAMGLDSTPTFIVNRTVYAGVMDQATWAKILDAALAK